LNVAVLCVGYVFPLHPLARLERRRVGRGDGVARGIGERQAQHEVAHRPPDGTVRPFAGDLERLPRRTARGYVSFVGTRR
jgi:hypothetical protein